MQLLDYVWREKFEIVINIATKNCKTIKITASNHFREVTKMMLV